MEMKRLSILIANLLLGYVQPISHISSHTYIHQLVCPLIHQFTCHQSSIHLSTQTFLHLTILLNVHPFFRSYFYLSIHPFIHPQAFISY
jgi:hypothetical protein